MSRSDVLVTADQLPSVLAKLRGEEPPAPAAPPAAAASAAAAVAGPASGGDDRYGADPVGDMTRGYDEVDDEPDEDAWGLTGRE